MKPVCYGTYVSKREICQNCSLKGTCMLQLNDFSNKYIDDNIKIHEEISNKYRHLRELLVRKEYVLNEDFELKICDSENKSSFKIEIKQENNASKEIKTSLLNIIEDEMEKIRNEINSLKAGEYNE